MTSPLTIERLDRAIETTAKAMIAHPDLAPKILQTLKRLEAERDKLRDPIDYAKRILAA